MNIKFLKGNHCFLNKRRLSFIIWDIMLRKIFSKNLDSKNINQILLENRKWEYMFNPDKSIFGDYSESYFRHIETGEILNINALQAIKLIEDKRRHSIKKIFNKNVNKGIKKDEIELVKKFFIEMGIEYEIPSKENIIKGKEISDEDIKLFLEEFDKGYLDYAIQELCLSNIEFVDSNFKNYISIYL